MNVNQKVIINSLLDYQMKTSDTSRIQKKYNLFEVAIYCSELIHADDNVYLVKSNK